MECPSCHTNNPEDSQFCSRCGTRLTEPGPIAFSKTITIGPAFKVLRMANPDGWGVAFYPDKSAVVFKEPVNAVESGLAKFLETYPGLKSKILISHVRKASVGGRAQQNTHPFVRELNGREYVLAHNGTLKDFKQKLELGRFSPLGINDTEFLLCYLLGAIEKKAIENWDSQSFEWLQDELRKINDAGSLNCIFSDGSSLFAYHDKNGYNSLYHLFREKPAGRVKFTDLGKEYELEGLHSKSASGFIIATKPMTDEKWEKFRHGELLVFKDGIKLFQKTEK